MTGKRLRFRQRFRHNFWLPIRRRQRGSKQMGDTVTGPAAVPLALNLAATSHQVLARRFRQQAAPIRCQRTRHAPAMPLNEECDHARTGAASGPSGMADASACRISRAACVSANITRVETASNVMQKTSARPLNI